VQREELVELVTHLAFYAGWPSAVSAAEVLTSIFDED
jgi:4-carboxymuconolactone decarboxylase